MLKTGAILNFLLAVGHLACMPWLDEAFKLYGIDGVMNHLASSCDVLPYLITVVIALCFALCGFYALSAAGVIRRLPLLGLGIFTVAAVFLLRAMAGLYDMIFNGDYAFTTVSAFVVAAVIGLLYLLGGFKEYNPKR